jgi:alpha-L-fucosidase
MDMVSHEQKVGMTVDGDYLTYRDSHATLPVSITLDLGAPRQLSYLAVNQREWSPTDNRETFGRVEDSARIKDYRVSVSVDGVDWGDPVASGVMPSARGVQFIDLTLKRQSRFLRLDVATTWAAASVPRC